MNLLHIYKSIVNIYILEEKNIFNKVIYWIFVRRAYFVSRQLSGMLSFGLGLGEIQLNFSASVKNSVT